MAIAVAKIALVAPSANAHRVFAPQHYGRLASLGEFVDTRFERSVFEVSERLAGTELIVSTWGMPRLTEEFLAAVPNLQAVFYAAGSVKGFVTPASWARGIVISSAAPMNAIPVAEYTLAVILLSNKNFWSLMRGRQKSEMPGNYRRVVGIIGASMVGREVIRLLKLHDLSMLLYDPYVSQAEAGRLGVRKVDLPELMAASDIVSLHAPNLPHLHHMINAPLLALMKHGATFINTARGDLVDETALVAELQTGRIRAVLDVTAPEPPPPDSPLLTLPNVIYTPHIAGSMDQECRRMAEFAIDELDRYLKGEPLRNSVTEATLARLA